MEGFYKMTATNEPLLHAPNKVEHKDFLLIASDNATYVYPVDGWHWFNSREEAEAFFTEQGWVKPTVPNE